MSAKDAGREPKGVIAIATSPDGYVIATAADFDTSGYGGFKLYEAQRMRARDRVKRDMVRAYCSSVVSDAVRAYTLDCIADDLKQAGHRIVYRAVGYPDDIKSEIER